jgi:hypothetical protein
MLDESAADEAQITKDIQAVAAERRRFVRKNVLWAATVEVRGRQIEGVITDLSAGGARLRFNAPLDKGEELRLILSEFEAVGAKVVWQRDGEAGVQFVLAPAEVLGLLARRQVAEELREAWASTGEPAAPKPDPAVT